MSRTSVHRHRRERCPCWTSVESEQNIQRNTDAAQRATRNIESTDSPTTYVATSQYVRTTSESNAWHVIYKMIIGRVIVAYIIPRTTLALKSNVYGDCTTGTRGSKNKSLISLLSSSIHGEPMLSSHFILFLKRHLGAPRPCVGKVPVAKTRRRELRSHVSRSRARVHVSSQQRYFPGSNIYNNIRRNNANAWVREASRQ